MRLAHLVVRQTVSFFFLFFLNFFQDPPAAPVGIPKPPIDVKVARVMEAREPAAHGRPGSGVDDDVTGHSRR